MGIISSFIYKFKNELNISEIPEEYRKYFKEISDFEQDKPISIDIVCMAITRKLKDEVYFRVKPFEEQMKKSIIGGLTGYDINLQDKITPNQIDIITDSNNKVLSAYDVAMYVYEKAKNINVFRQMHENFFYMFEMREKADIASEKNVEGDR